MAASFIGKLSTLDKYLRVSYHLNITVTQLAILLVLITLVLLPSAVLAAEPNCQSPRNTIEVNECAGVRLTQAGTEMTRYLDKSIERYSDDPEVVFAIKSGQHAWSEYADKHCNSIHTKWRGGTIRTVMALDCKIRLTQERTHQLWLDYLTYMDSAKPILPEPVLPKQ